ncbi:MULTISPECIES: YeeE/YedE family protein [Halocynthiibacter]|uniref:YeeE/YedE family protein n=1 Tax=Halocynthiibacter halioticoli TaxID=2986804 RepID=A0AAE3IXC8_9RHOB|nr:MULTISPECIES: YeeE/YedE family protein [Halocynthiibacter]MCV6823972.1 YeeE/YedE family protein [Halocynthiibacter halioticoli]MCW4056973.1 YeeE/YedE family protein [Halocynthiibacter sp. SDUM655004]
MEQSYIYGLVGGLVIGLAGAIYLLGNGRIMGASGIIGGLVDGSGLSEWRDRALFVFGLIAAPWIAVKVMNLDAQTNITSDPVILIAAGLLVGFGARLANGCTSGHGVCGISRLSLRGIAATGFYLFAGGVSVLLFKHLLGVI